MTGEMEVFKELDVTLAAIGLFVFSVGVPGNISAFTYFLLRRRDIPTTLHTILSGVDSLICIFILPVALSLASNREPVLFGSQVICTLWGAVWTWAPYMSVFLIAILSITRTLVLLRPLRTISRKCILMVVVAYAIWIAARMVTPMIVEGPLYTYMNTSVECMWESQSNLLNDFSLITVILFLAPPVIPIMVSCIISSFVILDSIKNIHAGAAGRDRKRSATITIVILTMTYLFLNFPLFLYLSGYTYFFITHRKEGWFSDTFDNYLWNIVYIILIGVNSLANFIVYICRIRQYRQFCISCVTGQVFNLRTNLNRSSVHRNGLVAKGISETNQNGVCNLRHTASNQTLQTRIKLDNIERVM